MDYICAQLRRLEIPISKYPGPVARIWTPNTNGKGLLDLHISDQARTSPEVTFDELCDSIANRQMRAPEIAHQKALLALEALRKVGTLRDNAIKLTQEAISRAQGSMPTMTEARVLETAYADSPRGSEAKTTEKLRDEAMEAHEEMMRAMLSAEDQEEDDHV